MIRKALKRTHTKAAFFFTGNFYENSKHREDIIQLRKDNHYLGYHSDKHLLYCDWNKRDSLLVSKDSFLTDLQHVKWKAKKFGIDSPRFFVPPYEWWNDSIAVWTTGAGMQLVSFTPGIGTNADYTWPEMGKSYRSNRELLQRLYAFEENRQGKLNGAIILIHTGTDPRRKEKFYNELENLIIAWKKKGYVFKTPDELWK